SATTTPGAYTLFAKTDGYDSGGKYFGTSLLTEADETNNVVSASLTLPTRPNLTASSLSFGTITVNANGSYSFPVTFTVTNNGVSTAKASWYDFAYLSTDATLDTTDPYLNYAFRTVNLAGGASYIVTFTAT